MIEEVSKEMPIQIGENPEDDQKMNKFISPDGEGQRGVVLALSKDRKEAVILALNSSTTGSVEWGKLYLVRESNPANYPKVMKRVSEIPNTKAWRIPASIMTGCAQ